MIKKMFSPNGFVINNRLFNLIHLVQEKNFSLLSFIHVQGLQGLWVACGTSRANRANEYRPHVQHVLAPKTIFVK